MINNVSDIPSTKRNHITSLHKIIYIGTRTSQLAVVLKLAGEPLTRACVWPFQFWFISLLTSLALRCLLNISQMETVTPLIKHSFAANSEMFWKVERDGWGCKYLLIFNRKMTWASALLCFWLLIIGFVSFFYLIMTFLII